MNSYVFLHLSALHNYLCFAAKFFDGGENLLALVPVFYGQIIMAAPPTRNIAL